MSEKNTQNTDSRAKPKKIVLRLVVPTKPRTMAQIASETLKGLKSGAQTAKAAPKTDFEQRAAQTTANLKRVGVRYE